MKIAVIHLALTTESGDPRIVFLVGKTLKEKGHRVVIYTAEFNREACFPDLNQGLDVRVIPPRAPLSSVLGASGIASRIFERFRRNMLFTDTAARIGAALEGDFELVICENDYSYKIGIQYKKINPAAHFVWLMHNPPFEHSVKRNILINFLAYLMAWWEKMSARRFARGVDWVVVYDEARRRIGKEVGAPVKVIGNPVDFKKFFAPVKHIAPGEEIILLSVGALSPSRRFEDTVSAVAILRREGYNVRALIVAKDYWADQIYRTQFEKHIEASGVKGYIDVRFGGLSDPEYVRALKTSHIFLLPNNIKIWGVGAFEAMAAGVPLVASRITDVAGALEDGANALLVDPLRPDQIAEKIKLLISNAGLYRTIATKGQRFVKSNFGVEHYIDEILTLRNTPSS